jgi:signal transduction histidine kinase/CheY-like chemotaxis protein
MSEGPEARTDTVQRIGRRAPLFALLSALALLASGIGVSIYVDATYEHQRIAEVSAQARILAVTVTAALDFGDRQAAQDYMNALRGNPEITAAGLYEVSGARLASYPSDPPPGLPQTIRTEIPPTPSGDVVNVMAPVVLDNATLGYVLLQTPTESVVRRVQRYGAIALLLAMAALLVAVLSAAQAALRGANRALAQRAQELAEANRVLQEEIAQREQAEAALRQSQKMEVIGQLTGGVAHDFNNLLQVVLGSLERLRVLAMRGNGRLDPSMDRMVNAAMHAGQRAATLTQRLLAFSRRQSLAPRLLDLNKLVAGMSDLLARTLGEQVHVETVLAGGLWRVLADENQMENALLNLAVNARDAMPAGGKLTIETANAHLDEFYARAEEEVLPGQYVQVAVTDTGSGMRPEVVEKVFEPFFTTKDIGKGTGLGLSQVYGFIKQSGGHVKIYSEPGQGTTVKMYLPRLLNPAEEDAPSVNVRTMPQGRMADCILVVEDEDAVRALTVDTLVDLGYSVLQASNGSAALSVLAREPAVKLLFTDVGLPGGMNGRQLADAARIARPGLKVLFTTGYARNAIVHHGRLDPGVELIGKPFSAVDLANRVRAMLDAGEG